MPRRACCARALYLQGMNTLPHFFLAGVVDLATVVGLAAATVATVGFARAGGRRPDHSDGGGLGRGHGLGRSDGDGLRRADRRFRRDQCRGTLCGRGRGGSLQLLRVRPPKARVRVPTRPRGRPLWRWRSLRQRRALQRWPRPRAPPMLRPEALAAASRAACSATERRC